MKHILFSDTTIKQNNYELSSNQFDIIKILYEKGNNKDFEFEIKKKNVCL